MPLTKQTEKLLSEVVKERRAAPRFDDTPVPDDDLRKIVEAGRQAPSGYNLQPWRFVIVQEATQKGRLQKAVMDQPKVGEAPVVIVACGDPEAWRRGDLDQMLELAKQHGYGGDAEHQAVRRNIERFLGGTLGEAGGLKPDLAVWLNRQVMIAFTHMMLMAEALGHDTAPMEGFFEDKVKDVLGIPAHVRVVAVLAVGRVKGEDKPYGGRFETHKIAFSERWGQGFA